jgi:hypothetical protein
MPGTMDAACQAYTANAWEPADAGPSLSEELEDEMEQRQIARGGVEREGRTEGADTAGDWNSHDQRAAPAAGRFAVGVVYLMFLGLVLFAFLCVFIEPILRLVKTVAGALRGTRVVPLVDPSVVVPGLARVSGTTPAQTGPQTVKIKRAG